MREWFARTVVVFFRSGFGEHYLNPASVWKTAVLLAIPLAAAQVLLASPELANATHTRFLRWVGSAIVLATLTLLIAQLYRLAIVHFVAASLLVVLGMVWPIRFLTLESFVSFTTRASFAGLFVAFAVAAAVRMLAAWKHPAPHRLCAGQPSSVWYRVPAKVRPWRDDWGVLLIAEPLVVGLIGLVLWTLFANWVGAFLLLTALCMRDAARVRYTEASNAVVVTVSGLLEAENVQSAVDEASGSVHAPRHAASTGSASAQRGPGAAMAPPFVAKRAPRPPGGARP